MKLLLDMNMPPSWCELLGGQGHEVVHWSAVGAPIAPDPEILEWAAQHEHVLITHDVGFGELLAASRSLAPSVVILRTDSASTPAVFASLCRVLEDQQQALATGAVVIVDGRRSRVRVLPLA